MSYTKKNLDTLSLLLTISILIIFYLIYSSISLAVISNNSLDSNMVYSQKIPIESQTQRQIIQANLSNKWRIQIPKLNLDAHIEEGTTWDVLLRAVGHFENTNRWNGNICLAGHNRGYQCNFFQKIKTLNLGDEIIYCTKQGKKVYQVQINKVILETDWSYLKDTKDNRITLITCEENREEYRRCIQAVQVSETKEIF
ncbi:MAG: class D sortase [Clostridia bacterium]|nr:class D sortase [Clostridia bacterium]